MLISRVTCRHTRKKTGRGAHWLLLNEPIIRVLAPLIAQLWSAACCLFAVRTSVSSFNNTNNL
jgi:hypothetical protein